MQNEESNDKLIRDTYFRGVMDAIKASGRLNYGITYFADFTSKKIFYVSPNNNLFVGLEDNEVCCIDYEYYLGHLSDADKEFFEKAQSAANEFIRDCSVEQRTDYVAYLNTKMEKNGKSVFLCHKIIPITFDEAGYIRYCLFNVSLSSRSDFEQYLILQNTRTKVYYTYNICTNKWLEQKSVILSKTEQRTIILSALGFTTEQICGIVNLSEDAIKRARTNAFKKLSVRNITEAVFVAGFYNIL